MVGRPRRDAAPRAVPVPRPGRRGRPRVYGEGRIPPAERAGPGRGWRVGPFEPYGKAVVERYETFPATGRPAGGVIRVVLVDELQGWVAYLCADPTAGVADILGPVADRFGPETAFRDVQEVAGAGRRQVRFLWARVGAFHLGLWTFTTTGAWAWGRDGEDLVGHRSASPWDDDPRRPGHADERRALLAGEIHAVLPPGATEREIAATAERLPNLAA